MDAVVLPSEALASMALLSLAHDVERMNPMHNSLLARGAKVLVKVCAAVKPGETVAIVTDLDRLDIADALARAVIYEDAEPVVMIMPPRTAHGQEPPEPIISGVCSADVVFAATTFSIAHTRARTKARAAGARFVNMPDYDNEMLIRGGLFADFHGLRPMVDRVRDVLSRGSEVLVTSQCGTRLSLDVSGRSGISSYGLSLDRGSSSSPPGIEAAVAPIEGSAQGTIVVDGSIPIPEIGKIEDPVKIIVRDGRIAEIQGGREARCLDAYLARDQEGSICVLCELGFGMNPEAVIRGRMLEDEGAYGTVHFGFGDNRTIGGMNSASGHFDMIVRTPTVEIDGKIMMKDGELT